MDLVTLQSILSTVWVVWFFVLFLGMLWFVLRPSKRQHYAGLADIPLRDEAGTAAREAGRQTSARSI